MMPFSFHLGMKGKTDIYIVWYATMPSIQKYMCLFFIINKLSILKMLIKSFYAGKQGLQCLKKKFHLHVFVSYDNEKNIVLQKQGTNVIIL